MIDIVPARAEMAAMFRPQEVQTRFGVDLSPGALQKFIDAGMSFAVVDDGQILCLGGVRNMWADRAVAWGLLSSGIGATMIPITRAVRRFLDTSPTRRIEAEVASDHEAGRRWVEMLGFEREGRMRSYWAGADFDLYARLRD